MVNEHPLQQGIIADVLRSIPDGVILFDRDQKILNVNPLIARLTGLPQEGFSLSEFRKLFQEKIAIDLKNTIEQVLTNGTGAHVEEVYIVSFFYEMFITPVRDAAGNITGGFILLRDITQEKELDHAKSEFVSLASHQLRTPLTEIRWALSSLKREKLTDEQMTTVEAAHKASSHMAETIKAMLTISHIETGELHPESTDVPLQLLINDVVSLYDAMRRKQNITLNIDCLEGMHVHTDAQLLKEILSNLLTNAYKYTPSGGSVHIEVKQEKEHVGIDIADTGCGIPRDEQHRITEKFFRGSNVIDKEEAGTGIGLHVVYALTKLLGGTVSFVSQEHKGTMFSLTLPSPLV